jgi:hypothetical protein
LSLVEVCHFAAFLPVSGDDGLPEVTAKFHVGNGAKEEAGPASCTDRFTLPAAPLHATDHNGVRLPDVCLRGDQHHVFVIGDWGGIMEEGRPPVPADHRAPGFKHERAFIDGVDDCAQLRVADAMKKRAAETPPEYIINLADNFYWAGIDVDCGGPCFDFNDETGQWARGFEEIYSGEGLDGKPWLGVLGNHDYGGWMFTKGWDRVIAYTWASDRWMTPALYWTVKVRYEDFTVDYFFTDTNVFDTWDPNADEHSSHNICSAKHNNAGASCGPQGPENLDACPSWFKNIWDQQWDWLMKEVPASNADWKVIVTHFPPIIPKWGSDDWAKLAEEHGVDLFVSSHIHYQRVYPPNTDGNPLGPAAIIISGGGGGVTSEDPPAPSGDDDQYGFMDITFSREEISIEMVSHGGQSRGTTKIEPRRRRLADKPPFAM